MRTLKDRIKREFGDGLSLYSSSLFLPLADHKMHFLPQEEEVVSSACEKRKVDFLTGRYCARKSMKALGLDGVFIPVSPSRAPLWPSSVVGSITHTEGYCAAVVGLSKDYLSIGIDGQKITGGRISEGMKKLILRDDEEWSGDLELNLVFSAKEALYKCLNPLVNQFFGFHCARVIAINSALKTFSIELTDSSVSDKLTGLVVEKKDPLLSGESRFEGFYEIHGDLVVTVIILKR